MVDVTKEMESRLARLTDLSVSFLSLVSKPATGKGLVLKSLQAGERASAFEIVKTDDERMVAYGIVYSPDEDDAHGDTADEVTIRRAAYQFMREGRLKAIDREHTFTEEMAYVAESWLIRKGDDLFPAEKPGSWAVGIQIGDPDLWRQLKSGELTGISLAGIARVDPEPDEAQASYVEKFLKSLLRKARDEPEPPETDMDEKTIRELVKDEMGKAIKSELAPAIGEALKAAMKSEEPPTDPKGDDAKSGDGAKADDAKSGDDPKSDADAKSGEGESEITKALAAFEKSMDAKIAKATAKGAIETEVEKSDKNGSFL